VDLPLFSKSTAWPGGGKGDGGSGDIGPRYGREMDERPGWRHLAVMSAMTVRAWTPRSAHRSPGSVPAGCAGTAGPQGAGRPGWCGSRPRDAPPGWHYYPPRQVRGRRRRPTAGPL